MSQAKTHSVDVCIVGGGPAGLLLGLLLAGQGLQTLVVEQHQDFAREYRGEVLMPRFSRLFTQLNLLDYIQQFPHTKIDALEIRAGQNEKGHFIPIADICPEFPFAFWMPQPVFLDALFQKAKTYPQFDLWFGTSATELIREEGKTVGVRLQQHGESGAQFIDVRAKVTVGADGRTSRLQKLGNFSFAFENYQYDVIWFSLPRPQNFKPTVQGLFTSSGPYVVLPKHPDLIQCGFITNPGQFASLRAQGVDSIKNILRNGPEVFQKFAGELQDFKPFHPLQAYIARIDQWAQDGLLLIGDAAHTCSPIGAVGVSIALETATVAADVLVQALKKNDVSAQTLNEVQRRRESAVMDVQHLQVQLGSTLITRSALPVWLLPWLTRMALQLHLVQKTMRRLVFGETVPVSSFLRLE